MWWNDWQTVQPEVWGPARVVSNLPYSSTDTTELATILTNSHYTQSYSYPEFACGTSSEILWYILTNLGYDTKIMAGSVDNSKTSHAWIIVKYPDGYVPIETTGSYDERLGTIITPGRTTHFCGGSTYTREDYLRGMLMNSSQEYNVYFSNSRCMCSTLEYELDVV